MKDAATVIIVGAGHRGLIYADHALSHPDELTVVGVVDPDPVRRRQAVERYGCDPANAWERVADLPSVPVADGAINATMDALHVPLGLELLERGYDMLLEKPIALDVDSMLALHRRATELGRQVMVCHVLRYAPFYATVRAELDAGSIGDVMTLELAEHVAYHHAATAFVRGKWSNEQACGSPMLLAKSCHDFDLLRWLAGVRPLRATSVGGLHYFTPDHAPEGSGSRCLVDCEIEATCPFSAKRLYLDNGWWSMYVTEPLTHLGRTPSLEELRDSLAGDNPYGRCVWRCDNDVVDRQSALVQLDGGVSATMTMVSGAARPNRTLHVVGTAGEIYGTLEDAVVHVRTYGDDLQGHLRTVDVAGGDMHGGGDARLAADFANLLRGAPTSPGVTTLADSIQGHLAAFAAERGRHEGRWVDIDLP